MVENEFEIAFPKAGELFESKYRIIKLIGSGGSARVFKARVEEVGRDVAIKILSPVEVNYNGALKDVESRFLLEARTLSGLKDPHTIILFDFGRSNTGFLYMVFEFIDGTPLNELIGNDGALGQSRVLKIMRQVLLSLREAHAVGILHRDIKPANIMVYRYLGEEDRVKVLDFGIAKSLETEVDKTKNLTRDGIVVGTPRYMSPEQIFQDHLSPSSDIYALGLVCFEMLTGRDAIPYSSDTDVVRAHVAMTPFRLPEALPIHPGTRRIIQKMIEKDHRNRYQSANDCLFEVDALIASGELEKTFAMAAAPFENALTSGSSLAAPIRVDAHSQTGFNAPAGIPAGFGSNPSTGTQVPQDLSRTQLPLNAQMTNQNASFQLASLSMPKGKTELNVETLRFQLKLPVAVSKTSLIPAGIAFVVFFFLYAIGMFLWVFALVIFLIVMGFVFSSSQVVIERNKDFKIITKYIVYEHPKTGNAKDIIRFEAVPFQDDLNLVMVTQHKQYVLARALPPEEVQYIVQQGNNWLQGR